MIRVTIPDLGDYQLEELILDYNGTLAIDGHLLPGVREKISQLAKSLNIHILTADTFGSAAEHLSGLPCKLTVISKESQDIAKLEYVNTLGASKCICIGNGRNDRRMLHAAALGIAVIQKEGASSETILSAKIVCGHIIDAFELLENPKRLIATLRC
jgi:soluble P-type ATPase